MNRQLSYSLEVFEGPLDLLLYLIQQNKVSIYDIPIAEISRQYMEYLEKMKELNLEVTSEFITVAAQLLYIKSRMLLPVNPIDKEEEDPRTELVERLLEYAKYKAASVYLQERESIGRYMFCKAPDKLPKAKIENHIEGVTVQDLFEIFKELLQNRKDEEMLPHRTFGEIVGREKVSVQSKIDQLMELLKETKHYPFRRLFRSLPSKAHAVAMFLGILELLKGGKISVYSDGEIQVGLKEEVSAHGTNDRTGA